MEIDRLAKSDDINDGQGPVNVRIDGVLDLHMFNPAEVKDLLPHYIMECLEIGILEIRVIHGKGGGTMRKTVHAILGRMPEVISYRLAGEDAGGWGATLATLRPTASERQL
ncbi:MAG: DNA mismatch repair protein MutS [Nitrospirae bacterium]|nr:MAG: DNA mismatch repair protein MutS [Nitrospirota bacterium]